MAVPVLDRRGRAFGTVGGQVATANAMLCRGDHVHPAGAGADGWRTVLALDRVRLRARVSRKAARGLRSVGGGALRYNVVDEGERAHRGGARPDDEPALGDSHLADAADAEERDAGEWALAGEVPSRSKDGRYEVATFVRCAAFISLTVRAQPSR